MSEAAEVEAWTRLSVRRGPAVGAVLPRVIGFLAGRAELSLDRVSDALLLADMIAAEWTLGEGEGDALAIEAAVAAGRLELRVGPLERGSTARLLAAPRASDMSVVGRLVDECEASADADGRERLRLALVAADPV